MSDLQTSYLMDNGTQLSIRPIHVTDEPKLRHLFYQLSQQSLYTRFMSMAKWVSHKQVQEFVYIDHRHEVSIVGTVPEADGEHVIALGGYFLDEETNRAEVAFVVQDEWQGRGIGTFLFEHLISIAKQSGIGGFTAEVLTSNASMQAVIRHAGLKTRSSVSEGVMHFEMDFN
jgi:GNAT superfamily N-acetyltransferase